ncbi:hypothetical protein SUGI_0293110 [Cryptomeria japonica]|nr:hypothetical protein SUGI_0293110 [Cryptomeria japonica]
MEGVPSIKSDWNTTIISSMDSFSMVNNRIPRIVEDFRAFAKVCFREFGDRVNTILIHLDLETVVQEILRRNHIFLLIMFCYRMLKQLNSIEKIFRPNKRVLSTWSFW